MVYEGKKAGWWTGLHWVSEVKQEPNPPLPMPPPGAAVAGEAPIGR